MKLYAIRHAQPQLKTYAGFPGPSLGIEGRKQAKAIAQFLADKGIEQVFMSDYIRVKETFAAFRPFFKGKPFVEKRLRERENTEESHESLVARVHEWMEEKQECLQQKNTAIFSHCGPINMILSYLDPQKELFEYPYTDAFGCHTPLAGIWELEWQPRLGGRLRVVV